MEFVIYRADLGTYDSPRKEWRLVGAAGALARSPASFASTAEARADIAVFKKAASGVRFAKVNER